MTNAMQLLSQTSALGVVLTVENGNLKYAAPPATLTPQLRQRLAERRAEILSLSPIPLAVFQIAAIWNGEIEPTEGDAAWAWLRESSHGQAIGRAEDEVNRIGSKGDLVKLKAACQEWLAAWVAAIEAWNDMEPARCCQPFLAIAPRIRAGQACSAGKEGA